MVPAGLEEMNALFQAAHDLQEFCRGHGWRFCFIGGLAVQRWSIPRFTKDADMTLLTEFDLDDECIAALLARFSSPRPDAVEFAHRVRVVVLQHENGVTMDVALGALAFEVRSVERATLWQADDGIELLTCCAEDLIVHKAFASRDLDWVDVQRILDAQGRKLNIAQIFDELRPLVELKEDGGIIPRLEWEMKKKGLL